jgi:hypothetical protein
LVVIDHDENIARDTAAHRSQCAQVIRKTGVSKPKLHRLEPAGKQRLGFIRKILRLHQPQSSAVIGRDGAAFGPEQLAQRLADGDRRRIPEADVKRRKRHAYRPSHAQQREAS